MGLLKVRRDGLKSYYSLTEDGACFLDKGAQRIFKRKRNNWDGGSCTDGDNSACSM